MTLLLAALLAGAATLWVIQPVLARRSALLADTAPGHLLDAEARKRVALAALKEIEYDFLAGKLDEADYRAQRDRLSAEALVAIRAAEAAQAGPPAPARPSPPGPLSRYGERGRTAGPVAAMAAGSQFPSPGIGGGTGEGGQQPHACGFVNPAGSRFCAGCGARLT